MPTWGIVLLVIALVIVLVIGFIAGIYNILVQLDERVMKHGRTLRYN